MAKQEHYELRIYQNFDYEKQQVVENYLSNAFLPALKRMGIGPVGVFNRQDDENDHSVYVVIPFQTLDQFSGMNAALAADQEYMANAAEYFACPLDDPSVTRIESRLLKAFAGMPTLELPAQTKDNAPRIFELRLYESHTEHHAALKVEMFNEGEIQIMKDVDLGPVFFGETLIAPDVPNLVYMLSATDEAAHKEHFQAFLKSEGWDRMKKIEKYKGTVSKIKNWFLKPTSYSEI